jgi:hypothetical protein
VRYWDLLKALERARRLFATSESWAPDDDDCFWAVPCNECRGNQAYVRPNPGGVQAKHDPPLEPFPIHATGTCAECAAIREGWKCLDTGLSVTKARLDARDNAALFKAYGVSLELFTSGRRLPKVNAITTTAQPGETK